VAVEAGRPVEQDSPILDHSVEFGPRRFGQGGLAPGARLPGRHAHGRQTQGRPIRQNHGLAIGGSGSAQGFGAGRRDSPGKRAKQGAEIAGKHGHRPSS